MSSYNYQHLPDDSIRLLHLLPHLDKDSPIHCRLSTCAILGSARSTHNYEALSYVWGSKADQKPIYLDGEEILHSPNLHSALTHLRDEFFERILWVDAVCINQNDNVEKGLQVQSMAGIYAKASGVIVWLGEDGEEDGETALETIRGAAARATPSGYLLREKKRKRTKAYLAVRRLLNRPWFERIWVLQEVAAARQTWIQCGRATIPGYIFCLGIEALRLPGLFDRAEHEDVNRKMALVRSVIYLIRGACFRSRQNVEINDPEGTGFDLDIAPFRLLLDLYHTRKATNRLDMIYALLGMAVHDTDSPNVPTLRPNYDAHWNQVFAEAIKLCFPSLLTVRIVNDGSGALIRTKARVIGEVISVLEDDGGNYLLGTRPTNRYWTHISLTVSGGAYPVQEGDFVCELEGPSSSPIIARSLDDSYIQIIALWAEITATSTCSDPENAVVHDFVFFWDWNHARLAQHEDDILDTAFRMWTSGILLLYAASDSGNSGSERCYDALKIITSETSSGDEETSKIATRLLSLVKTEKDPVDIACEYKDEAMLMLLIECGHLSAVEPWLLHWAINNGKISLIKMLLGGPDKPGKLDASCIADRNYTTLGRTALTSAAAKGDPQVFQILLEAVLTLENTDLNAQDDTGSTPLDCAVENGRAEILRLLLEKKKMDMEPKDGVLRTAAEKGYDSVVKLLLENSNPDIVCSTDADGRCPLSLAAWNGHAAVVELLLAAEGIDPNSRDGQGHTPLFYAANAGQSEVVKLLLADSRVDWDDADQVIDLVKECRFEYVDLFDKLDEGRSTVFMVLKRQLLRFFGGEYFAAEVPPFRQDDYEDTHIVTQGGLLRRYSI
ncbi:hypothetical protein QBC38DRAFT_488845 [Podospora fimiseda]|uniref:Heterokaryon incompatibility domain-containing protein n=1 Tax=Podospora fimiseda TaxID=252190 RepID=A0AAN7BEJ0_9PEZI|nr:hypothetical protein QBC38DRAFT_488845 [Podospora fimiseda]